MRKIIIVMLALTVALAGCKKHQQQQAQNQVQLPPVQSGQQYQAMPSVQPAAPVVTQMNTLIAPLSPEAAQSSNRVLVETVFNCGGKTKFTVRFKPNAADIDIGWGKTVTLVQQPFNNKGFRYANPQYDLRGKGPNAILTVAGNKPLSCIAAGRPKSK